MNFRQSRNGKFSKSLNGFKGVRLMVDLSEKVAQFRRDLERQTLSVRELSCVLGISQKKARRLTHIPGFPVLVFGRSRLTVASRLGPWLDDNIGKIF